MEKLWRTLKMRFKDCISFSIFNIKSHIARTIITIIIQIILTAIIFAVLWSVFAGYDSAKQDIVKDVNENGINFSYQTNAVSSNVISESEFYYIDDTIKQTKFDYSIKETKYSAIVEEFEIYVDIIISNLINNENGVFLTKGLFDYINQFQKYEVGDMISTNLLVGEAKYSTHFTIIGIFEDNMERGIYLSYQNSFNVGIPIISSIYYQLYSTETKFSVISKTILNMEKNLKKILTTDNNFYISTLTSIKNLQIGIEILLPISILITSILLWILLGSIINSLFLTCLENERFFALCISQGLQKKSLYIIVMIEFVFTTIFSIIISSLISFGLKNTISGVSNKLWAIFYDGVISTTSSPAFPFLLPLIIFVLSLVFCAIFTIYVFKRRYSNSIVEMLKGER